MRLIGFGKQCNFCTYRFGLNFKTDIFFHYVANVIDTSNPMRAIGLLVKNHDTLLIEPMGLGYNVRTVGLLVRHRPIY